MFLYIYIALASVFFWLIVVSFIVFNMKKHYYKLISNTKRGQIDSILEKLIDDDKSSQKEIDQIKKEIVKIEETSKLYLQKVGIVRFNPFAHIGGDQSFVLALLNHENNGAVVNFIYTREGIRVYAKKVKSGKGIEYELSEEEKEAVKKSS